MNILKIVSNNISLFDDKSNAIIPHEKNLAKYGEEKVVDEIEYTLDKEHFLFLVKHIQNNLPYQYPEIDKDKWDDIGSYIEQKSYKEFILAAFKIVRFSSFNTDNLYKSIIEAWYAMNKDRYQRGIKTVPNYYPPREFVIPTSDVHFIPINGKNEMTAEDVKKVGTLQTLEHLVNGILDDDILSFVMQQVVLFWFADLGEKGLLKSEDILQEDDFEIGALKGTHEQEAVLGGVFAAYEYEIGMVILVDFLNENFEEHCESLAEAIAGALSYYNVSVEINDQANL